MRIEQHRISLLRFNLFLILSHLICATSAGAADGDSTATLTMDPQVAEIVNKLLAAEAQQEQTLQDVTFDATLYERRVNGDGDIKEEKRFDKTVYFQRRADSARYWNVHEVFHSYSNRRKRKSSQRKSRISWKSKRRAGATTRDGRSPMSLSPVFASITPTPTAVSSIPLSRDMSAT